MYTNLLFLINRNTFRVITFITTFFCLFVYATSFCIFANEASFAISSQVNQEVVSGDIVCTYPEGIKRCINAYDSSMYGVISTSPAVLIEDLDLDSSQNIVTFGTVLVRVSAVGGNIKRGDLITTSENPGIGQKSSENGFVLGTSLDDYDFESESEVGEIAVMLNIHIDSGFSGSRGNLLQFIRKGITVPIYGPLESLRYLLAVAIVVISFTLGMIYFGRASKAGIEAIGRNPLAKKVIQLTVFLNISLTIVIVLVGLGIAYMILVL